MHRCFPLVLAALLLTGCTGKSSDAGPSSGGLEIAPRLTGKSLTGDYLALEDYRGKVVLLNVWATWCPPCREELPTLRDLQAHHRDDDFVVLGVSIDTDGARPQVVRMARQFRLEYPILLDPRSASVRAFDIRGYPTSILVGRDGRMLWRREGLIAPEDREVEAQIRAALALQPPLEQGPPPRPEP